MIINDLFCTLLFHVPNFEHPNPKAADKVNTLFKSRTAGQLASYYPSNFFEIAGG